MASLLRHQRGPCAGSPAGVAPPGPRAWPADSAGVVSAGRSTASRDVALRTIRDVVADAGDAPAVRDIGHRVGVPSPGRVARQLGCLERPGLISSDRRGDQTPRSAVRPYPSHRSQVLRPVADGFSGAEPPLRGGPQGVQFRRAWTG
ncbi:hypothetical protein [Streptomyces sp. NPDC005262]|uniref:LexA family protein n=1 Tax=Streptomyces sp. NPDC005262 TaxID=3364710 RepID=UPI0036AA2B63